MEEGDRVFEEERSYQNLIEQLIEDKREQVQTLDKAKVKTYDRTGLIMSTLWDERVCMYTTYVNVNDVQTHSCVWDSKAMSRLLKIEQSRFFIN